MNRIVAGLFIAGLGAGGACAASFDAVTGFSLTTNTAANTWSYWGTPNTSVAGYAGDVALLPVLFPGTCGSGTSCWDASSGTQNLILDNVTGADVLGFPNSDARNNQLTYFNRTGVLDLRFLVPATGTYSLSGFFEGSSPSPESTRDVIVVNSNIGSPLFNVGPGLLAFGSIQNFNFASLSFNAGDIVDFLVAGTQTTPDANSLATGFDATFSSGSTSPVPEPATLAIVGAGLLLLTWRAGRKWFPADAEDQ
jgi:hypothetical protein